MKIFNTENKKVTKIVHDDKSETAIKNVESCFHNPVNFSVEYKERKKYTIFISTSVGCFMSCKFCHLTLKNMKYKNLSYKEIIENLKEAIRYKLSINPELKDYYVKLSFMGMGDAVNESDKVVKISLDILKWMFENKCAKGLDGVDLSTVFPKPCRKEIWLKNFNYLNDKLKEFEINPNHINKNRTPFRLFYSIHTLNPIKRDALIPKSLNPVEVMLQLRDKRIEFNVIFHYMFLDNRNDTENEINDLINYIGSKELRILRYNDCAESEFKETKEKKFKNIVKKLVDRGLNVKIQVSPGSEIQAACGQFIAEG